MLRIWDLFRDDVFLCFPNYVRLVEVLKQNVGVNLFFYLLLISPSLLNEMEVLALQCSRARNERKKGEVNSTFTWLVLYETGLELLELTEDFKNWFFPQHFCGW